ncbi:MAG: magnesium transporter, partial [Mycobacteriales bacterium]
MTTTAMTTTAPSRIFVARLAGLTVFDPVGDQVGRVRDVVATLRLEPQPPRVIGLVVKVQNRPIFVPISRVTSFDAGQVMLQTGKVDLRRFERRPGETLVLGDILDRKVTLRESGQPVTIYDCAMEPTRSEDWLITRVAVRTGGGMRRRAQVQQVPWDAVTGLTLAESEQGAARLLALYDGMRPADLAHA